jgi:fatty acid desaturase
MAGTLHPNKREPLFLRWLAPVLAEWAAIFILFAAGYALDHWLVWMIVVVIIGSRQHALAILGHEGGHFLVARNKKLNDLATELLCFWPVGVGLRAYRTFHLQHHRHTNTDLDPEWSARNKDPEKRWAVPKTRRQILTLFVLDLVGVGSRELITVRWSLGWHGASDRLGPMLWWGAFGVITWLTGFWLAAILWVVALYTSFWGFFRLRSWTEHLGTQSTHRITANWWQRLLFTPHNTWYHYEHHQHPGVPCWRLPKLRSADAVTVPVGVLYDSFAAPDTWSKLTTSRDLA